MTKPKRIKKSTRNLPRTQAFGFHANFEGLRMTCGREVRAAGRWRWAHTYVATGARVK